MGGPRRAEIESRVAAIDFERVAGELDARGHARIPDFLPGEACRELAALYDRPTLFRKRVNLAQHRFGDVGEYQYFAYPLPEAIEALRQAVYAPLARIANAWRARLGSRERFPDRLEPFLARCRRKGQSRPTPLLLRYGAGGYNRLHQDLYGAVAFPLQMAVLLSQPASEFEGGEFLLLEQRPREQARVEVLALGPGEAVVFPNRERPERSARGDRRVQVRHGVARIRSGARTTLGIIFHDAQ
jgi:hypothetical protein